MLLFSIYKDKNYIRGNVVIAINGENTCVQILGENRIFDRLRGFALFLYRIFMFKALLTAFSFHSIPEIRIYLFQVSP